MQTPTLPSLGPGNFITDSATILTTQFANAIAAKYSESNDYIGSITSLDYIFANFNENADALTDRVINSLTVMYKRYFPQVTVMSTAVAITDDKINLKIYVSVTDNKGDVFSLGKVVLLENGVLKGIIDEINK